MTARPSNHANHLLCGKELTVLERIDAAIALEVAQGRKPTKLILTEPDRRLLDIEREGIVIWIRGLPIESGDGLTIVTAK